VFAIVADYYFTEQREAALQDARGEFADEKRQLSIEVTQLISVTALECTIVLVLHVTC
jgi:hypothetical protein